MTLYAIEHLGEREVFDAGAGRDRIVTGGAVQVEPVFHFKVLDVGKSDIDVFARGGGVNAGKAAGFGEARVFNFFGSVTSAAAFGAHPSRQLRPHAWF